jgi:hypothetical protein
LSIRETVPEADGETWAVNVTLSPKIEVEMGAEVRVVVVAVWPCRKLASARDPASLTM